MSERQEIATGKEGVSDQEFTVGNSDGNPAVCEILVNVKTLERCFNEGLTGKWEILLTRSKAGFRLHI